MKILKCEVTNFGSYKSLEFDFSDSGLALVHGATGSGKSTLQDVVPWILFGITSKGGNVNEIRNWKAGSELTVGTLFLELNSTELCITRVRGPTNQNDLYWRLMDSELTAHRGKDLADTQKRINELLNMNYETYSTAATFNEFSESSLFFLAKAKDKRQVFEKIADLSFATHLTEKLSESRKLAKKDLDTKTNHLSVQKALLEQLERSLVTTSSSYEQWEKDRILHITKIESRCQNFEKIKQSSIDALETKSFKFEDDKKRKIEDLVDKLDGLDGKIKTPAFFEDKLKRAKAALPPHCPTCGKVNSTNDKIEKLKAAIDVNNSYLARFNEYSNRLRETQELVNPYKDQIVEAKKAKNHYAEQLKEKKVESNPFEAQLSKAEEDYIKAEDATNKQSALWEVAKSRHGGLDQLYDLSFELRAVMLRNVVKRIQMNTNDYLSKYFDSEFQVKFELADADSLDVEILKNGFPCVYKQLSKGQRQLLKLCFSVSVMEAASDNIGAHFNLLTFDEALDGLDADLKVKAFSLFENLSKKHSSVLVIDHTPEFQNLFDSKYKVDLIGDESFIIHE